MIFTCNRDALLKEIAIAQEIIANKNALTILSNVLLTAENNALTIQATETRTSFQTKIPVDVREEGTTTVFCDKFSGILSALPPGDIEFVKEESSVTIKPLEKKAKFVLKSIASDKFPPVSFGEKEFFEIPAADFKNMISHTIFSVSDDEARYFMNGVYFDQKDDAFILVATDGRRLSYCEKKIFSEAVKIPHVIVPPKILNIILKRAPNEGVIKMSIGDKAIYFEFGNYQFSSILIDGQFPNYERVIPKDQKYYFEVNKGELQEALKRGGAFVENKLPRIIFELSPGTLMISSEEDEMGSAQEQIPCEYTGEEVSLVFNNSYVDEPLKFAETERVRFEFTEVSKAVTLRPEPEKDYFHIIMPMQ